jgi:tetratricopeptide (TPR) repeat protein
MTTSILRARSAATPFAILLLLLISGTRAASAQVDSFDALAAEAAAARTANDGPKAIELYRRALKLRSTWIEGWWFLGTLSYDSDEYAACKDALSHLVQLLDANALPTLSAPALTILGLCEYSTEDYNAALDHIQHGLKVSNGKLETSMEAVARFHEALLLTKTGLYDSALRHLFPFAKTHTADSALTTAIGIASLRRPLLPQEVPADQEQVVTAAGKATYLWMTGDEHAEDALKALVAEYKLTPNIHFLFGTYLIDRRTEDAMVEFRQELRIDPSNHAAEAMLALQLYRTGKFDEALTYAKQALEGDGKLPKAHLAMGLLLARQGRTGDAAEQFQAACDLEPGDFECHTALATAYSRLGRPEESRRERFAAMELAGESAPDGH